MKESDKITDSISLDYIMGKFDPKEDKRFVEVDKKFASRSGLYLRKEAYEAFLRLVEEAKKDGLSFKILSATRNFDYQKGIWERKWNGQTLVGGKNLSKTIIDEVERAKKILEFSSMPGTSRHHWGTDFDLNAFENSYFEKGQGKQEYEWLVRNAGKFGFCQPYSKKDELRPFGYNEEKWHWSYNPLSKTFTQLAELKLKAEMITGFDGSNAATKLKVVHHYVLGINNECYK